MKKTNFVASDYHEKFFGNISSESAHKFLEINCDEDATNFSNLELIEHRTSGHPLRIKMKNVALYCHTGGLIKGYELKRSVEHKKLLNINFLKFLLLHQELIPVELRGTYLLAMGTVYKNRAGHLEVPNIHWIREHWVLGMSWLGNDFGQRTKVLILKEEVKDDQKKKKKEEKKEEKKIKKAAKKAARANDPGGSKFVFRVIVVLLIILLIIALKNWAILGSI